MKKLLLVLTFLFAFNKAKTQTAFCPPGAEWHYTFWQTFSLEISNEKSNTCAIQLYQTIPQKFSMPNGSLTRPMMNM
jgi:hypothetical protein